MALVSINPDRSQILATESISARMSRGSFAPTVHKNGTPLGPMTYKYSTGGDNVYGYNLTDKALVGDTITVQDGAAVLHTYDVVIAIINISIDVFEAVRCDSAGSATDDGENIKITALKISSDADVASMALYSGITIGNVTVNLSQSDLEDALTPQGYTESVPTLFSGYTFSNGTTYNGTVTIGTANGTVSQAFVIARAFANMHFSGADTGGVAFGGFSSATHGDPKLESYYPAYFYAGLGELLDLSGGEVATGLKWIDGSMIYAQAVSGTFTGTSEQKIGQLSDFLRIDKIVRITGAALMGGSGNVREINSYTGSTYTYCYVNAIGEVYAQSSVTGSKTFHAVVLYTKT